jgi:hypothetical protein
MFGSVATRRTLATVTVAIAASVGSVAGVSLAQGSVGSSPGTSVPSAAQGSILPGVQNVLAQLVAAGTIDDQQAAAIQAEANAGSIDPKQLVDSGIISDTQMRVVADRIDALKRSAG